MGRKTGKSKEAAVLWASRQRPEWGVGPVTAFLKILQMRVNHKAVARIRKEAGLRGSLAGDREPSVAFARGADERPPPQLSQQQNPKKEGEHMERIIKTAPIEDESTEQHIMIVEWDLVDSSLKAYSARLEDEDGEDIDLPMDDRAHAERVFEYLRNLGR